MKFPSLFQPIQIGSMTVRNRFVKPPMGSNTAEDDCSVGQRMIDYYTEAAKGGFGLITIEVTAVSPTGNAIIRQPGLYDDRFIDGYRKLADSIHAHGAKMSVQLHHAGRQTMSAVIGGQQPVAPSPLPCPFCQEIPHELTTEETYEMIRNFVDAAERAKKAGADAVEVHGAHGYLIAEFMSVYSNRRTDEFGGSFENRMRFPRLIVEGIRERLGNDFPIIFRMSGEEKTPAGRGIAESRAVARVMEEAGVNAMHVAAGAYGSLEWIWGCYDSPLAYMAKFAEEVKKSVSIPVIAVGRINDPYIAEELVASGRVDMVSIGRQSIADPAFPNKAYAGKLDEIIPCVGCHQGCSQEMLLGNCITCIANPTAGGYTGSRRIVPAETKKKVTVVGGGPGGLAAAWLLTERGHEVELYEKSEVLGGQYRIAALPPTKGDLAKAIRFYINKCEKNGVRIHLGSEMTAESILEGKPDAVILATGAVALKPRIKGIDNPAFAEATDILEGKAVAGRKVLVVGGGLVGLETADYLGDYGRKVDVIDMIPEIGTEVNTMVKINMMRRMEQNKIGIHPGTKVCEFTDDGAICECNGEKVEYTGYDTVVLAMGRKANNPLEAELKDKVEVHVIGDAEEAGFVLRATHGAAEVALGL